MTEYLGARISLISKADIRYVGILDKIDSDTSTVALQNVQSMGTENRKQGEGSIRASDRIYDYIVFRGSDVKDLKIEQVAPEQTRQEQIPDDPAILGSTRPPQQVGTPGHQYPPPFNQPPPPGYGQNLPPHPPHMHPGFGRGGFPPGPGGPGYAYPPYGAPPPGWGPPGQGFPSGTGPFSPQPPGIPPQRQENIQPQQQPTPIGQRKPVEQKTPAEAPSQPEPSRPTPVAPKKAPTPPVESKPDVAAAVAPPASTARAVPTGPRANRAPIPRTQAPAAAQAAPIQSVQAAASTAQTYANATQAATAAVAAAMAKLPMAQKPGQTDGAMDNLTKKVQDMRTDEQTRHPRQQGAGIPRGRGRGRGGHHNQVRPMEVPKTDYDFESANAKFNKEDLVKEAIASGSPIGTPGAEGANGLEANGEANDSERKTEEVVIPKSEQMYDKKSSFFDNISSELKDREDTRGREFRAEERKKNMETFGQGSVDNYRRGYGRGRGRGYRGGGRGFGQRGGGEGRGGFAPRGRGQAAAGTDA